MKYLPFCLLSLLLSCTQGETASSDTLVNTKHLDHLYDEVKLGETTLGVIWIYCEAPDYRLVGDEDEGFACVDDVARALVFYCRQFQSQHSTELVKKIQRLTAFLLYMQAPNGYFYNFILPGGQINKTHQNSVAIPAFWSWRALWALSELQLLNDPGLEDIQQQAGHAIDALIVNMAQLCPAPAQTAEFDGIVIPACLAELGADQVSVMIMGLANYYQAKPSEMRKDLLLLLGNLLLEAQSGDEATPPYHAFLSWRNIWHAWGNSQAYALLKAGRLLEYEPFIRAGLAEVRHFYPYCLEQGLLSEFSLVKRDGQNEMVGVKTFPQIAYNLRPMIFAALEAYAITNDPVCKEIATELGRWFTGNNPAGAAMYDPVTGRTFDGINAPGEVNRNAGAESTIEGLLALQALEQYPEVIALMRR